MESEFAVGQQKVRFDREATRTLYRDAITVPDADTCGCTSCKNFAAQRRTVYPEQFLSVLEKLGVDPLKEWEAFDYDFDTESPSHLYGGWFVFVGELIDGAESRPEGRPFTYWFTGIFPASDKSISGKLCAIEFLVKVPWVVPSS